MDMAFTFFTCYVVLNTLMQCNPVLTQPPSSEPITDEITLQYQYHFPDSEFGSSASSVGLNRNATPYEMDVFESMREHDNDLSLRTTANNLDRHNPREVVQFLRPMFGNYGRRLYFNLSALPTNVNITRAEVVFSPSISNPLMHDISISVPINDTTSVLHGRFLNNAIYIVDVSDTVRSEKSSLQPTMTVTIRMPQRSFRSRLLSRDRRIQQLQPILSVFENIDYESILSSLEKRKRKRRSGTNADKKSSIDNIYSDTDKNQCYVERWIFDFEYVRWYWIILPKKFYVNSCSGGCNATKGYFLQDTWNSFFKSMYNPMKNTITANTSKLGCTPTEYNPLTLYFHDSSRGVHIIERLDKVTITACGCR